ncbi:MAG: ABC transporter ATP-binding protein [Phascolarctobacterium sp.]|nr:ABC transporter ATP-binding protein [Phascolarctobacterium sp.]
MLNSFLHYYKPHKTVVLLIILGSILSAALELVFPMVVRHILNTLLPSGEIPTVLTYALFLGIAYLLNMLLSYVMNYYGFAMSAVIENDMRKDLYTHIQKLSYKFFDNTQSGTLLSRVMNDVSEISELAFRAPADIIVCVLSMVGTMLILLFLNPLLGFVVGILLIIKTIHTVYINQKMKGTYMKTRVALGNLTAKADEGIKGVRLTKAFAAEDEILRAFNQSASDYLGVRYATFRLRAYFMGSISFFTNAINLVILAIGAILIGNKQLTLSDFVVFFLYIGIFIKPLMRLLMFTELYQRGMAGYRRFYEIMSIEPDITDSPDAKVAEKLQGNIVFDHVGFSYENGKDIIKDLCLNIKPGEKVAFVGSTGAGKTTLANLLLRFYEPQKGKIIVDGIDIKNYTQASLRSQIGLVQQDVFLFSNSVRENILLGCTNISEDDIVEAAKKAAADSFIDELKDGYNTKIGERGVKLSGGQRQRLAIARVFLKNPPILVLDEATSALDNQTEKLIQKQLDDLAQGRTTIIIAHRLSTIQNADKIVVLENGSVAEIGTHEELLAKQGAYYKLYGANKTEE